MYANLCPLNSVDGAFKNRPVDLDKKWISQRPQWQKKQNILRWNKEGG